MLSTDGGKLKVSISEIRNFKECPRRWYLKHILGITPPQVGDARILGTLTHSALEVLYRTGGDYDAARKHLDQEIQKIPPEDLPSGDVSMLQRLLDEYYMFAKDAGDFTKWDVLSVEAFHTAYVPEWDAVFNARFDLVLREKSSGAVFIVDHKTTKHFQSAALDLDEQVTSYIWFARRFYGTAVKGLIYNRIKKVDPVDVSQVPALQTGLPSKNLSKLTKVSPATYRRALANHGVDADPEYVKVLEKKAEPGAHPFFRRDVLTRNDAEMSVFVRTTREVIERMRETAVSPVKAYASPGLLCSWCDYASLCKMLSEGKSVDEIIDAAKMMSYDVRNKNTKGGGKDVLH